MTWNHNLVFDFLDLLQNEDILWNPANLNHKKKQLVEDAWIRISKILKRPVSEIKLKKHSLMSNYRRERKKKEDSIRSGASVSEVYEPIWFAYSRMEAFLLGVDSCGTTTDSINYQVIRIVFCQILIFFLLHSLLLN